MHSESVLPVSISRSTHTQIRPHTHGRRMKSSRRRCFPQSFVCVKASPMMSS